MELKPFLRRGQLQERPVELVADLLKGRLLRRRLQHLADQAGLAAPLEQRGEHVHHAVDDRPREVGAKDADEQRAVVRLLQAEPHRTGDAERHDEPEEDLAEPVGGIQISTYEGGHGGLASEADHRRGTFPLPTPKVNAGGGNHGTRPARS